METTARFHFKTKKNMKNKLLLYLQSVCKTQKWAKSQISKEKKKVEKINVNSIASVKQKLD